jgi:hypothetical protein
LSLVEAYFDESGTHRASPVLCVAGYLFESEAARRFAAGWLKVLARHELSHFHMVDCAHGNEEFARLSKQERIDVAKDLIDLIKANTLRGVGAYLMKEAFTELMPHHPQLGSDYNYCIWNCLELVGGWIAEVSYEGDIAYFFEAGHQSQSQTNRLMTDAFSDAETRAQWRYRSHSFVDKLEFPGVQAADIFAWQMAIDAKHGATGRPRRKDFAYLIEDHNHRGSIVDAERILHHVQLMREKGAWDAGVA